MYNVTACCWKHKVKKKSHMLLDFPWINLKMRSLLQHKVADGIQTEAHWKYCLWPELVVFLLRPHWDEICPDDENIRPKIRQQYYSYFECECVCLFITECRRVSGCVHYCLNKCPPMISEGLHLTPSAPCDLLFLVTVWWVTGVELQRLLSLSVGVCFFTYLPRSAASPPRAQGISGCLFTPAVCSGVN